MFEKHKYKILATVLILVLLGAGTFYYLKKKREKKEADEKAALEAAEEAAAQKKNRGQGFHQRSSWTKHHDYSRSKKRFRSGLILMQHINQFKMKEKLVLYQKPLLAAGLLALLLVLYFYRHKIFKGNFFFRNNSG